MNREEMIDQIQARLVKNYERQVRFYTINDHIKSNILDEHWLKRQFKIMDLIRKNYSECAMLFRDGTLPFKYIMSESRRTVERHLKGIW